VDDSVHARCRKMGRREAENVAGRRARFVAACIRGSRIVQSIIGLHVPTLFEFRADRMFHRRAGRLAELLVTPRSLQLARSMRQLNHWTEQAAAPFDTRTDDNSVSQGIKG